MKSVSLNELRELIFNEINPTIEARRASDENYFWPEHNPPATEQEIDDFILSVPCFTQELKNFLLNEFFGGGEMLVSDEWREEFVQQVNIWAKSFEWLGNDISLVTGSPVSAIEVTKEPLGMCAIET